MVSRSTKQKEAIKMFPDLKSKKPPEIYARMTQKGYEWNSLESRWESEADKEELPVVNINIKCQNALIDDTIEQLKEMLEEYGIELLNTPRPYPAKERDSKGQLIQSKTHSTAYIQYRFPDNYEDEESEESGEFEEV